MAAKMAMPAEARHRIAVQAAVVVGAVEQAGLPCGQRNGRRQKQHQQECHHEAHNSGLVVEERSGHESCDCAGKG